MTTGNILVADDDAAIRTVLSRALSGAGYDVSATGTAATLWGWVKAGDGSLVITDVVMPDESAFELLPRIKKLRPELPIIVMSAQNTFKTAIKASERCAFYDYIPKPFDLHELVSIVGRAMSEPNGRGKTKLAEDIESMPHVRHSPAMQEIHRSLERLMQLVDTELSLDSNGSGTPRLKAGGVASPEIGMNRQASMALSSSVERHMSKLFGSYGEGLPPPGLYHRVLRELEQPLISAALAATHGNKIRAAEVLGLNRNTLRKKIRDLDIRSMRSPRQ